VELATVTQIHTYNRSMLASAVNPSAPNFWHLPENAAAHGHALDTHLLLNLWIALGLIALAHLILLAGLAFRKSAARPTHTLLLEYLPISALTLIFVFLAIRSERLWATQRYTGADFSAMQVEVTGMQFAWYFRYPGADQAFGQTRLALASAAEGNPLGLDPADRYGKDDIVTSQLVLPAGREVDLTLRAQDVIHGFAVPEMRLKQNAVPGETVHIHFTPQVPGEYAILCTQVCGLGHYRMQATMRVLVPTEFDAWLKKRESATEARP
jgi:cytochrome c oxidase subunit 2